MLTNQKAHGKQTRIKVLSKENLAKLLSTAKEGDSDAQFEAGLYYWDKGIHEDKKYIQKALYFYTEAVKQKNIRALCNFGLIYLKGEYVTENTLLAVIYFYGSAVQGSEAALKNLEKLVEKGNVDALFSLALMYHLGEGVKKNIKIAGQFYKQAAKKGSSEALRNLGMTTYYKAKNIPRAIQYFYRATLQGDAHSQEILERLADPRDYNIADAQFYMGVLYDDVSGSESTRFFKINYKEAAKWYSLAVKQGYPEAQCNLGRLYDFGRIEQNKAKAAKLYYLSALQKQGAEKSLKLLANEGEQKAKYYLVKLEQYAQPERQARQLPTLSSHDPTVFFNTRAKLPSSPLETNTSITQASNPN